MITSHSRHKSHMTEQSRMKSGGGGIAGHFQKDSGSSSKPKEDNEA